MAGTVEEQIEAMYQEWFKAIDAGDRGWFERTLHDDFIYTDIEGTPHDKANVIAMDLGLHDTEIELREFRVRPFGDAAIVHAHYWARTLSDGTNLTPTLRRTYETGAEMRFTAVWGKHAGRWQVLAHQATRLPD